MLNPPRDRPSPSRSARTAGSSGGSAGSAGGSAAEFLSFDRAPCVVRGVRNDRPFHDGVYHDRRLHNLGQPRRQPLRCNVLGRFMTCPRGVLMRPDHRRVDPDQPLRTLVLITPRPQPIQEPLPRTIS